MSFENLKKKEKEEEEVDRKKIQHLTPVDDKRGDAERL